MYTESFKELASHYKERSDFYFASWLRFKREASPSEGGSYKDIEEDRADRVTPALLDAHIHVRERQNKPGGDTLNIKTAFTPAFFSKSVTDGRTSIIPPKEKPDSEKGNQPRKLGYDGLFHLAKEFGHLAKLYTMDFSMLADLLPSKRIDRVLFHLISIGNELTADEALMIEFLNLKKMEKPAEAATEEKKAIPKRRNRKIKEFILNNFKTDHDAILEIKKGSRKEFEKRIDELCLKLNYLEDLKKTGAITWYDILFYFNVDKNGIHSSLKYRAEKKCRDDVFKMIERETGKKIKLV